MKKIIFKTFLLLALFATFLVLLVACKDECDHPYMSEVTVDPTHEKEGRTVYYCLDCDYEYSSSFTPPVGHSLTKELHSPTCTEQGYTYNYCQCGYHYTSDYTPPLGHTLSIESVDPTCDTEGYKVADCCVCGYHYTFDVVSPRGHELSVERTYVSLDNEVATSTYTCTKCELNYVGDYVFYNDIYKGAYVSNSTVVAKGIDVSRHQHEQDANGNWLPLDWAQIKAQGYDFAILRIGYMGSGNVGKLDPVFEMNYKAAKEAGLAVGAYIYSYAYTVSDARAEAEFVMQAIEGKQFEYPIFLDVEDNLILNNATDSITDICSEFVNILQSNGYFAAIYANPNWLINHMDTQKVTTLFDVWYARWLTADTSTVVNEATWNKDYGEQMAMWQFSQTGNIEGIYYPYSKNEDGSQKLVSFDLNYSYKDYPSIIKKYGLNGFDAPKDTTNLDGEYSDANTQ